MKIHICICLIILTCSSCATLFNSRTKNLEIFTDTPAAVVINNDTLKNDDHKIHSAEILRQKNPLELIVSNDSLSKKVTVNSKYSFAYWANFGFCYGLGMIIDRKNPKKYTYPGSVYINMRNADNAYATIDSAGIKNKFIVKFTPLKAVGFTNSAIEISCERRTGSRLSSQVTVSYLLPAGEKAKGFRASLEEKYYLKKSAPIGKYIGLEFSYMKNQYEDLWYFGVKNIFSDTSYNRTNYPDTFGIKKQTFSLNLKLGYQKFYRSVSFDFYAGVGVRYKDVKHFNRINPIDEMEMTRHPNIYYLTNLNGKYWAVSIPLNIKIGWIF